ncbi:MAG TPA: DUF4365 domain-containing protein [Clostridia bacterium]|nr:DUF4365 domain-containing protein [Clostridia bacterium]
MNFYSTLMAQSRRQTRITLREVDMLLPNAPANLGQERQGIAAVARSMAEWGLIWRETEASDVGIDGQIEYVNALGNATGCLVAVQAKSGKSYLKDGGDHWIFYPKEKHRFYWERFPIPVLVLIYDGSTGITYWVDARQALRSPEGSQSAFIAVPKGNQLHSTSPATLFEAYGVSQEPVLESVELIKLMISKLHQNPQFPLNYLELFAHGMTNICSSIYFSMDVACSVVKYKLVASGSECGMTVGEQEHEFMFNFVKFLLAQHLAEVNFSDCLINWSERQMQPTFMAPLTSRGRDLVRTIRALQDELTRSGRLPETKYLGVAQEDFVRMEFAPSHYDRVELVAFCKVIVEPA